MRLYTLYIFRGRWMRISQSLRKFPYELMLIDSHGPVPVIPTEKPQQPCDGDFYQDVMESCVPLHGNTARPLFQETLGGLRAWG